MPSKKTSQTEDSNVSNSDKDVLKAEEELKHYMDNDVVKAEDHFIQVQKDMEKEENSNETYREAMQQLVNCIEHINKLLTIIEKEQSDEFQLKFGRLHYLVALYYIDNDNLEESETYLLIAVNEFERQFAFVFFLETY